MALRNPAPVSEALTRHMAQLEAKVSAIEASTLSAGAHADGADHTQACAVHDTRFSTAAPGGAGRDPMWARTAAACMQTRLQLARGGMESCSPPCLCNSNMAVVKRVVAASFCIGYVLSTASFDTRRLTATSVYPGRSAQAAAREAAAAASRAARDPAALQQLGSALAALQQQVPTAGVRYVTEDLGALLLVQTDVG